MSECMTFFHSEKIHVLHLAFVFANLLSCMQPASLGLAQVANNPVSLCSYKLRNTLVSLNIKSNNICHPLPANQLIGFVHICFWLAKFALLIAVLNTSRVPGETPSGAQGVNYLWMGGSLDGSSHFPAELIKVLLHSVCSSTHFALGQEPSCWQAQLKGGGVVSKNNLFPPLLWWTVWG